MYIIYIYVIYIYVHIINSMNFEPSARVHFHEHGMECVMWIGSHMAWHDCSLVLRREHIYIYTLMFHSHASYS